MLRTIRLRLGRVSPLPPRLAAPLSTTSNRPARFGLREGVAPDPRGRYDPNRSVTDREALKDVETPRRRTKPAADSNPKRRFEYLPEGKLARPGSRPAEESSSAASSSSSARARADQDFYYDPQPIQTTIVQSSRSRSHQQSTSTPSEAEPRYTRSTNSTDDASSEPAQAILPQPPSEELDEFFGGFVVPHEPAPPPSDPEPPVPRKNVTPLASYTPPTHSGVVELKGYLMEHKFLSTQQIFQMGTAHMRAPIPESFAYGPDGRIKMKRVATMREGRRTWIPPMQASFPSHPFRSVRFLKSTLLASLENAGLIHKRCIARPLETEEEHREAIARAESQNRKMERRAALKGYPAPPVKAPATSIPVWGWLLGPRPELIIHPDDVEYAERLKRGGEEEDDLSKAEKEMRVMSGQSMYPLEGESMGVTAEQEEVNDQQMQYQIGRDKEQAEGGTSDVFGRTLSGESERRSWGERGVRPQPIDAAASDSTSSDGQVPFHLRPRPSQTDNPSPSSSPSTSSPVDTTTTPTFKRKVRHIYPPPYTLEEARLKTDYQVSHLQWQWAEHAEYEYHKAKLYEAEAAAQRQQIRRARGAERAMLRQAELAQIEESGLTEEVQKEKRRLEAIDHVLQYARLTGHDVSEWVKEMSGKLGEYIPYEPRFEHRGGAVPRGDKNPRKGWKVHGFPIN